jgi:hypothetical protein
MISHCRECGGDQLFDQPHQDLGCCPDGPGDECPEWACTQCGAALFAGIPDLLAGAGLRGRAGRAGRAA